jgi:hypothetical protein
MLLMVGPVMFEVQPFNMDAHTHSHESTFAEKPVVGARSPLEWVGEGQETWTVRGKVFPHRFGGMGSLALLYQARAAGLPQYMMRGDGILMGWVVIERVNEQSSHLDAGGVGRMIEFDIALRRCTAPSAGSYFSVLSGVFK